MLKCDLYLGDCLDVMKNIPDGSVDMILCDLPYGTTACKWDNVIPLKDNINGMDYETFMLDKYKNGIDFKTAKIEWENNLKLGLWSIYKRIIKQNGAIILFGTEPFSTKLRISNLKDYKYDWVWNKVTARGHLVSKKRPMQQTENISVFNCNYKSYHPIMINRENERKDISVEYSRTEIIGGKITKQKEKIIRNKKYPKNLLIFSNASQKNKFHPTQKPVDLLEYLITTYTREGEIVIDNCMGSGSTGVACLNTGRKFIGIELDKEYFNISCNRIKETIDKNNIDCQLNIYD